MAEGLGDLALGRGGRSGLGRVGGGGARGVGPASTGAGGAARGRVAAAEHRPAERRPDAARPAAPTPTRCVAYLQRWMLVDEQRAAAVAAVPVRSAVAGVHLHLRRG